MILMDRGLWEYVDGDQVPPEVTINMSADAKAKADEWKKKDNCALAQIALTVSNSELVHIKGAHSAREAWLKICNVYEAKGLAAKIFLRRKFFNVKLREGDTMQSHINYVRELADQLDAIGAPVADDDIAMTLLCSLPEQYDPLIVALEARPSNELTSEFVTARLLAEEKRRQESFNGKVNTNSEAAFIGNSQSSGMKSNKLKFCVFCKKHRHTEDTCYLKHGYPVGHPLHGKQNKGTNDHAAVSKLSSGNGNNSTGEADGSGSQFAFASKLSGFPKDRNDWFLDSAASRHYCNIREAFESYQSIPVRNITLGDNRVIPAIGTGTVPVKLLVDGNVLSGVLTEVLYVPTMGYNLVSVSKLTEAGVQANFAGEEGIITTKSGKVLGRAKKTEAGLYRLPIQTTKSSTPNSTSALATMTSGNNSGVNAKLWHARLGHLGFNGMRSLKVHQLAKDFPANNIVNESDADLITQCEACIKGKAHRTAMPQIATHRAKKPGELVHSDVCGPMSIPSLGGARYFVTFIDDYSRYVVVRLMKSKAEVMQHFMEYQTWVSNFTNNRMKMFRSDNGGEYISKAFDQLLINLGITRQKSPPYTPEHNGVAERANRTIVECARSMLHGASLNLSYWGEAVMTAVYLRNRSPTRALDNSTPFEAWTSEKPSLGHLRVFGCKAYAHIADARRTKLEAKAVQCVFVGYSLESKAYRLYDPVRQQIMISRDVTFLENQQYDGDEVVEIIGGGGAASTLPSNDPPAVVPEMKSDVDEEEVKSDVDEKGQPSPMIVPQPAPNDNNNGEATDVRRSTRLRRPPVQYWDLDSQQSPSSALITTLDDSEPLYALAVNHAINAEPLTFKDAMKRSNAQLWMQAAKDEYNSIQAAGTWTLVPLPTDRVPIGCKWTFKIKHNADGSVERYKARLCAKGYSQQQGIDYTETFAPVAKFSSIRALLALAAHYDLEIHQMDIKTAFLNGDLDEDIYMIQPEGFVVKGKESWVCKLNKSLYGLKQASRAWYQKMDQALLNLRFKRLHADLASMSSVTIS